MTSVRGRRHPHQKRPSIAPSIIPSIAPPDSFPPFESGDKLFDQLAGPSRGKLLTNSPPAAINIPKYSKDDLQRIFKTVLEAWVPALAPAPAPVPAPVVFKVPQEKLKARSSDVYGGKSHIDCYNFCQQCENYFATIGVTESTQILFATSFLWDRINFRWQ